MKSPEGPAAGTPTRRQFGKKLALLAAVPLAAPAVTAAVAAAEVADDKPKDKDAPPAVAVAEALTEIVRVRHGKHLSDEQMKQVKLSILRSQLSAERLRKLELRNADELTFAFRADLP
jgi:hypothetical protein